MKKNFYYYILILNALFDIISLMMAYIYPESVREFIPMTMVSESWFIMAIAKYAIKMKENTGISPISVRLKSIPYIIGGIIFGFIGNENIVGIRAVLIGSLGIVLIIISKVICFSEASQSNN